MFINSESKNFLQKYITSFDDNGIQLKLFLNEELGRLKRLVRESLNQKEIEDYLHKKLQTMNLN